MNHVAQHYVAVTYTISIFKRLALIQVEKIDMDKPFNVKVTEQSPVEFTKSKMLIHAILLNLVW